MPGVDGAQAGERRPGDLELFRMSPFLAELAGDGAWRETGRDTEEEGWWSGGEDRRPNLQNFRRDFRRILPDRENALLALRRLRVRTLLALARADLGGFIKPHQLRSRLRSLSEVMVHGAWWTAEQGLREKYIHPIIMERRNINPPLAICSLSRLGSGEPWYTTGPAPLFVHSRAAEFAPALREKDFDQARRSGKEWTPARDYFHRLASRTMSYLSAPDPAGRGYHHMAEDLDPDSPLLMPGALVVLFSAFDEHFQSKRPVRERLALMRLRFVAGQEKLGRAVEAAARESLLKTAADLGSRLPSAVNTWYRERARAEGLPLISGGLLDIERRLRLVQFERAAEEPDLLVPSPLRALDLLSRRGVIDGEAALALNRSYSWQWFLVNRMSLLGRRSALDAGVLRTGRLDDDLALPGASEKTMKLLRAGREALADLSRGAGRDDAA